MLNADLTGFDSAKKATPAHHKIMKRLTSPLFGGMRVTDDVLDLILHVFSESEADLVQHLPLMIPRTAEGIAKKSGRSVNEVTSVMDNLSFKKKVILAAGNRRRYCIVPLLPGMFEMVLMTTSTASLTSWHRRFSELFERIWEAGCLSDFNIGKKAPIRYLQIGAVQNRTLQSAYPASRLEEVLDRYDDFAVGHCQCRLAMELTDKGCKKPTENCVAIGRKMVDELSNRGMMRKVDKKEVIAIKRDAEQHGCVTFMFNTVDPMFGNGSCSCCGCCCHAMKGVKEFSVPGLICQPQFLPGKDDDKCNACNRCLTICPMEAWSNHDQSLRFRQERCIGCGLCVVACKQDALGLFPAVREGGPESSWMMLLAKLLPGYLTGSLSIMARRMLG